MNHTSPKQIGDYNKNQMLSILRERGPRSRVELSRLMGISQTAVTRNTLKLLTNGIIRECGAEHSIMGRKPVLIDICGDFCYVLVADIVGGGLKAALADLLGNIVEYYEEPIQYNSTARSVMEQLLCVLKNIISESGIPKEKIWSVIIGTPGIFDPDSGKSHLAYFWEGWDQIDIRKEVFDSIDIDTLIENDVNLDLIGESWKGVGREYENILYVKLGQGLASRFVLDNKLIRGEHRMAGEIGLMLPGLSQDININYENLLCNDAVSKQYRTSNGNGNVNTISELCQLADDGDEKALHVLNNMLDHFALVLLNSAAVLDPDVIILGGDACSFKQREINHLKKKIEPHFPFPHNIIISGLEKKASLYGAIKMGLSRVEERITEIW